MTSILAKLSSWLVVVGAVAALALLSFGGHERGASSGVAAYRPFFILMVVTMMAIFSVVAAIVAAPLGKLSETMDRFGAGDLAARVRTDRLDEIGRVARNFDRMADRIETLVTAERRLIQDVSHELRAPLARLRFATELVKDADNPAAAIERLNREIDRLGELVGSLMQIARAEGDPASARRTAVPLDRLVRQIVDDGDMRRDRVDLQIERGVTVVGDAELLRRAVENVVANAMQHGHEARVQIQLAAADGTARVVVRDFGPGVPDEVLSEIFKPFYRVDDARSQTQGGGIGLGLAIAQRAVTLHGGRIWAENAHPGLRVTLEVPLDVAVGHRAGR